MARVEESARPVPAGTQPQPERQEPRLADPSLWRLSFSDYKAIVVCAAKETLDDNIPSVAAALAYSTFLAIPSLLLLAVGLFGLVAGPGTVDTIVGKLGSVMPADATRLIDESLTRVTQSDAGTGVALISIGAVLALWSLTSAMGTLIWGLNTAYGRRESRSFLKVRTTSLAMLALVALAFLLSFGLVVLGPPLSRWVGSAIGAQSVVSWIWWAAQWPVLVAGLLVAFGAVLYLGPNVKQPRLHFLTPGAVIACAVWLASSGLFAFYVSRFGSYNKAWGSLSAVVVMLTWLWLSGLALLFGAEVNVEAERSRELRRGEPAEEELQLPARA